jgi:2-keto-4-pentenoate hydratase
MRPAEAASGPEAVARALLAARHARRPADARALETALTGPEDAYAAQALVAREGAFHAPGLPRFWKSGGPSRPSLLVHAGVPDAGVRHSPANARDLHFNIRLIEAEVALRLGRDVTPDEAARLTHEGAAALVDAMAAAIEVVDSRWQQGVQAAALLKLADLQSHGALVLGAWRAFEPRDWDRQDCTVRIGDAPAQTFRGTHALHDPAWLLPIWLRHATRQGETVPRGTVVTTGTWCGMLPAEAGDRVRVAFEGLGEAEVQL